MAEKRDKEKIALVTDFLLSNNYQLTALELYVELLEDGYEDGRLKAHFANAALFTSTEKRSSHRRSESVSSFNSTGTSEVFECSDPEHATMFEKKNDEIALLKHDLRLAREDMETLQRKLLTTQAAASQAAAETIRAPGTPSSATSPGSGSDNGEKIGEREPTQEHEKRALRYIVGRVLSQFGHKMTLATFSEEVADEQDIDDWHDVGSARQPPDAVELYRAWSNPQPDTASTKRSEEHAAAMAVAEEEAQVLRERSTALEKELTEARAQVKKANHELKKARAQALIDSAGPAPAPAPDAPVARPLPPPPGGVDRHEPARRVSFTRLHALLQSLQPPDPSEGRPVDASEGGGLALVRDSDFSIVRVMAGVLPTITNNLKNDRKTDLVPIITCLLRWADSADTRRNLVQTLCGLANEPNSTQRKMIVEALLLLAPTFPADVFVTEILPAVFNELRGLSCGRGILTAEVCIAAAPLIEPSAAGTLLDALRDLVDNAAQDALVHAAAARGLAMVVAFGPEKARFAEAMQMVIRLLRTPHDAVEEVATSILVPMMGEWAHHTGGSPAAVIDAVFDDLITRLKKHETAKSSPTERDMRHMVLVLKVIGTLQSRLFASLMLSAPREVTDAAKVDPMVVLATASLHPTPYKVSDQNGLVAVSPDQTVRTALQSLLTAQRSRKAAWAVADWLLGTFPARMVEVAGTTPAEGELASTVLRVCRDMEDMYGAELSDALAAVLLRPLTALPEVISERARADLAKGRLLPLYVVGVLALQGEDAVLKYLRELLVHIALADFGWSRGHLDALVVTVNRIAEFSPRLRRPVLQMLFESVGSTLAPVRALVVDTFAGLVPRLDDESVGTVVMPALVTLASDSDRFIRNACVGAFGVIATCTQSESVLSKVEAKFDDFVRERNREVNTYLMRTFTTIVPKTSTNFRENVVARMLLDMAQGIAEDEDKEFQTSAIAPLFECFKAYNGCILGKEAVEKYLLPGLQLLAGAAQDLEEYRKEIEAMMEEMATNAGINTKKGKFSVSFPKGKLFTFGNKKT